MPLDLDQLGDEPLSNVPTPTPEAKELLWSCKVLLNNDRASWAWDTVQGIRDTVQKLGRCTEAQQRAIGNIAFKVQDQEERGEDRRTAGGSRRYEGYRKW